MTLLRSPRVPWLAFGAALATLLAAPSLHAQEVGSIRGRVIEASSLRPLSAAQVSVPGTGLGTLTNASGEFLIPNVPAGARTVRAEMIGYGQAEQTVDLTAGGSVQVEFELTTQALALDEVVVTGVAGGTQRRAVGNVVDQISVEAITELSPATSVNQLISQRSPGVQLQGSAGTVGAGSPIRIRGITSLELGAEPLIYIDGVRMSSTIGGPGQRGGSRMSRLDDINMDDIESIEIIKGPAAATLYGTEASNGVIQIVTRRGAAGAPQFNVTTRLGTHWLWNPEERTGWSYSGNPHTAQLDSVNLYAHERDFGPYGDPFDYGSLLETDLSVRGGANLIRYFVSGSYGDQVGVIPYNWDKQYSVRSNVDANLSDNLRAELNMAYMSRTYRAAQVTLATDHFGNLVWGSPARLDTPTRGWLNAPPEASEEVDSRASRGRTIASFGLHYNPREWLANRLILGLDVVEGQSSTLYPRHPDGVNHWWGSNSLGSKSASYNNNRIISVDYGTSATLDVSSSLRSTTSFGFQYTGSQNHSIGSSGSEFAAPPLTTVSAGATRSGTESFSESASVGLYLQEQFDWRNRVFLTAAVRGDDHSAFGADYDAAIYPKLSATWVVHEEPFFRVDWVDQLRLRAAWGAAGQQPSQFAAVRLYSPITGYGDRPGIQPSEIGNDALKPERSEELEVGFDLSIFDGRVDVQFTRYDRTVNDAMIDRPLPPSEGFTGSQTVNAGEIKAWGNEIAVNGRAIEGRRFLWEVGGTFATMRNRVERLLPGMESLGTGIGQQVEGYSISDLYFVTVLSADFVSGDYGPVTNLMCDGGTGPSGRDRGGAPVPCSEAPRVRWGHSQPTWQATFTQTFGIGPNLRFNTAIDATGGHMQIDLTPPAAHTSYCTTRVCRTQDDPIVQAYRAIGREPLGTYDASFARLREVGVSYNLPPPLIGWAGASRASLAFAMRNVMMLWTGEHGWNTPRSGKVTVPIGGGTVWDPEVRSTGTRSISYQTVMPPLATAVATLRVSF